PRSAEKQCRPSAAFGGRGARRFIPSAYMVRLSGTVVCLCARCGPIIAGMQGKRILLGVTGGIAAYKSADLVRRLRDRGAEVQVVMTAGAQKFVTPLTFQAVSGRPVRSELLDPAAEAGMGHIELARWADAILIAP